MMFTLVATPRVWEAREDSGGMECMVHGQHCSSSMYTNMSIHVSVFRIYFGYFICYTVEFLFNRVLNSSIQPFPSNGENTKCQMPKFM